MLDIFLKTLPFFGLIGLGYFACRTRFFTEEAAAYLTKFVFYFALSAMLFRFAATLPVSEIFDAQFVYAYLSASLAVYVLAIALSLLRGKSVEEAAVEAQCAVSGNTGFMGIPMFFLLLGEASTGPMLMVLTIDMLVFSSLIVILITGSRDGRMSLGILGTVIKGLFKNPMIVSILLGLIWSQTEIGLIGPADEFLTILGGAATPGALFAIGASLAAKSAERVSVASWLSFLKLIVHPAAVALAAFWVFSVEPFAALVMVAGASLPVAGNVYILAQQYGVAPQRVSSTILISTAVSIFTITGIIALLQG
ncbi:AEC family transporter [Cochlodiniinecator piscidefendens]|uniref:AEC family transporter n=1 Tax=Cochlodiniinecator piscidefendens TaxID=2715756 RepID=UPI00140A702D|nr:AEC family transporter [Cochlodiniinecator piscidefendens]